METKNGVRYMTGFIILFVLLAVLLIVNINAGSVHLSVGEVAEILLKHETGSINAKMKHGTFRRTDVDV